MDKRMRMIEGLDDEEAQPLPVRSVGVIDTDPKGNSFQTDLDSWLFRRRVVRLYVDVNEMSMADLQAKLQYLEAAAIAAGKPEDPIHLYINSPGGSVIQALSAYDTISGLTCPVYTYCNGYAASAGSLLFMAGDEGHRYILPNAKVMLHELSGGTRGKLTAMNQDNILSNHLEENLENIYAHHTGRPVREIRSWLRNGDRWLTAADAVAHNLADHIVDKNRANGPMKGLTKQVRLEPTVKRTATRRVKAGSKEVTGGKIALPAPDHLPKPGSTPENNGPELG